MTTNVIPAPRRTPENVRINGQWLLVEFLGLDDPQVVAAATTAVAAGQTLAEWTKAALRCGALALGAAGASAEATALRNTVEHLNEKVDRAVREGLDQLGKSVAASVAPTGTLAVATNAAVDRLTKELDRMLVGEDAAVATRIRDVVNRALQTNSNQLTAAMTANAASVAHSLEQDRTLAQERILAVLLPQLEEMRKQVGELTNATTKSQTIDQQALLSPQRGMTYQALVNEALQQVAQAAGDFGSDFVGDTPSDNGTHSKAGDVVVKYADGAGTLVCEAKSYGRRRLSHAAAVAEVGRAMVTRSATVGLLVMDDAQGMPNPGQTLCLLTDKSVAVVFSHDDGDVELLRTAYLLLRFVSRLEVASTHLDEPDLTGARRELASLRVSLKTWAAIAKSARTSAAAVGKIADTADQAKVDMAERIRRAEQCLNPKQ